MTKSYKLIIDTAKIPKIAKNNIERMGKVLIKAKPIYKIN